MGKGASSIVTPTIRHPSTPDAIAAYLASTGRTVTTARLVRYVKLMHYHGEQTTRQALAQLRRQGRIVRVRRGVYRGMGR